MPNIHKIIAILTLALLQGCSDPKEVSALKSEVSELKSIIESQKAQTEATRQRIELIESIIVDHENTLSDIKSENTLDAIAYLTPGNSGFQPIKISLGLITISLVDIASYANGSKVSLRFGNPLNADLSGIKMLAKYGPTDEKGFISEEQHKTKEIELIETLNAGSWTTVAVVLAGVKPENLGAVMISKFEISKIVLRK